MNNLIHAHIAAAVVSLISLAGILALALKENFLRKILIFFISFSAGAMLGSAFFHLLPEALLTGILPAKIFSFTLIGLIIFFVLEKFLRWHHCHDEECEAHQIKHLGHLNLIGDGAHNFIDGLVIMAGFSVNLPLGIAVALSIIFHEIPQEISDFGVLIYAGFSRRKALLYNLISAGLALLGVIGGYLLLKNIDHLNNFLLPFTAGGFIYIAASDLVPELHKENHPGRSIISFIVFLSAIILMMVSGE